MPSERIQRLIDKKANKETLTQAEQKSLYNYQYRLGKGKVKRAEAEVRQKTRNKQFCLSLPVDTLEALAVKMQVQEVTGRAIKAYLLQLARS